MQKKHDLKPTKKLYKIICPYCGEARMITRVGISAIKHGRNSAACWPCSRSKKVRDMLGKNEPETVKDYTPILTKSGCTISPCKSLSKLGNVDRCNGFERKCKHYFSCISIVSIRDWAGFTSDMKGFQAMTEKEWQNELRNL